eukprot:IDg2914t1
MPRGKSLSECKRTVIKKLIEEGKNITAVARLVGRSRKAVKIVLKPSNIKKKPGSRKKITKMTAPFIVRRAATGNFSERQLRSMF